MKTSGRKSKKNGQILRTSLRAPKTRLVLGIVFFCAGFVLLLSMTPAADHSRILGECIRMLNGLAGNTLHAGLPALLLLTGIRLTVSRHHDVSWRAHWTLCALYVLLLGFLTVITTIPGFGNLMPYVGDIANRRAGMKSPMSFEAYLSFAYTFGSVDLQAQGALGMAVAWPLWRLLGPVGGAVVLGAAMAALLIALFRIRVGDLFVSATNSVSDRIHRGRTDRQPAAEESYMEGIYPDDLQQPDYTPAADAGGAIPVRPAASSRYQAAADPVPPFNPYRDPVPVRTAGGAGVEDPRYYPVSSDQVYDEYVQERTGGPVRTPADGGRRRSGRTPSGVSAPVQDPGAGAAAGAQPLPPVFVREAQEPPAAWTAADGSVPAAGAAGSVTGDARVAGGNPPAMPAEQPDLRPGTPADFGNQTAAPAKPAAVKPAARSRREAPAQESLGDRPASQNSAETVIDVPAAAADTAGNSSGRTAYTAPAAKNGTEGRRTAAVRERAQAEADAKSLPADSQNTAQVRFNGAVPVNTGNVMEHSIDREPIGAGGGRQAESSDPLDGMAKDKNAMPVIETRSDVVYRFPPIDLLSPGINFNDQDHTQEDLQKARQIESTLESFNIPAKVMQIMHGPAITRFAIQIAPGIRVQRVTGMADNLALSLASKHVRVEAPIQGTNYIGIEVPNQLVSTVSLREVLDSPQMKQSRSPLAVSLGKDIAGTPVVCDLGKMPHLLIAGATGSGKSVCIHSIVCSLLFRSRPQDVRLIMIDPKQVELSEYNDVPHLLIPVVTDVRKAAGALGWAVKEMTERYSKFSAEGVRNLEGYNSLHLSDGKKMPNIVIIIDEMADLMDVCRKDVEEYIRRLAALARASGIYMVLATQRPSVDVITGVIKNNIPSRIAFAVSSGTDSRTILDTFGAEKLMGKGDMLYKPTGFTAYRVQGCFVSDAEVASVTRYIKEHSSPEYDSAILDHLSASGQKDSGPDVLDGAEADDDSAGVDSADELLHEAIQMAIEDGQTSTSMLQRRLRVGYARAGRLVDEMERRGVVSSQDGSKPRKTLITREQYYEMFADELQQEGQ